MKWCLHLQDTDLLKLDLAIWHNNTNLDPTSGSPTPETQRVYNPLGEVARAFVQWAVGGRFRTPCVMYPSPPPATTLREKRSGF